MKRWHDESSRTYREWKKHYLAHVQNNIDRNRGVGQNPYVIDCVCDGQQGRFRKTDAWDCGNTRCRLCHSDKYPKRERTYQEWCADLKFKEGIDELRRF